MKVSVIVPVYNVEEYIEKCLESLVNQTLKDIEIIIVDDGSPDNSYKIISKYLKKYKNILYLKKENGGLSSARNYGLKYAKSDYIFFLDSDDFLKPNSLELLYNKAIEKKFDLTVSKTNFIFPEKEQIVDAGINHDLLTKEDIKKNMIYLFPAACGKLYKRSVIKNLKFKEGIWFEDVEFNFRLYPLLNTIAYLDQDTVQYIQRENAITKTFNKRLFNYIDNFNGLVEYYKKNNYYFKYYEELEYSYVRYLYATFIKQLSFSHDKKMFSMGLEEALLNVKKQFPNYKKNTYLKKFTFKNFYLKHFNRFFAKILYIVNR